MSPRVLQILLSLLDGPLHGYGIKQSVEERTDGALRLGSGALYDGIARLVEEGLVEEVPASSKEPASGGPPRRFYALTKIGRGALEEELRRMDAVVRFARERKLIGREPAS